MDASTLPSPKASFVWTAKDNLSIWERILLLFAVLAITFHLAYLGYQLYRMLHLSYLNGLWLIPWWFSVARLLDWWPFTTGSFIYFRDGKMLYRIGTTGLKVQQASVAFDALDSVFLQPSSLTLRAGEAKYIVPSKPVPPKVWKQAMQVFFAELEKREHIKVTKLLDVDSKGKSIRPKSDN